MALIKEAQVAEMCGVALPTVRSWRHRGEGPRWFRVGARAVRYRSEDVESWLQAQYEATELGA